MGVQLQERDRRVLQTTFVARVISMDQLCRMFFSKNHRAVGYARILKLQRSGYLRSLYIEHKEGSRKCVKITDKGWDAIKTRYGQIDSPSLNSESPLHDVRMAEVAFRLSRLKSFRRLITENVLQTSMEFTSGPFRDLVNLQSDAVLEVADSTGAKFSYAVEYELSKKAPERYAQKLSTYYKTGAISGVLYVCSDNEIVSAIARADKRVCNRRQSIVHVALESTVLQSTDRITFNRISGGGIGLY